MPRRRSLIRNMAHSKSNPRMLSIQYSGFAGREGRQGMASAYSGKLCRIPCPYFAIICLHRIEFLVGDPPMRFGRQPFLLALSFLAFSGLSLIHAQTDVTRPPEAEIDNGVL